MLVAFLLPNITLVVLGRSVPVMVTRVPPPVEPWLGEGNVQRSLFSEETCGDRWNAPGPSVRLSRQGLVVDDAKRRHMW